VHKGKRIYKDSLNAVRIDDEGEYEYIADAYWIGIIKKDSPRDHTEYWKILY